MKKVKNKKSYFYTFKWTSKESETTFFMLTQSQKSFPAYTAQCAYASKDKMIRIWPKFKKKIFFISAPKVPYL
jgi:hypothetical protein